MPGSGKSYDTPDNKRDTVIYVLFAIGVVGGFIGGLWLLGRLLG